MENMYEVKPIVLGKILRDAGMIHYLSFYGQQIWLPVTIWYISGADYPILVDTGGSAKDFLRFVQMPAEDLISFEEALSTEGIKPEDIGMVICTHLHYDHVLNLDKCTNARKIVQKSELDFAKSPHPLFSHLYDPKMLNEINYEVVDGDLEILPGISLYHFGGHTPGSQGAAISTKSGIKVISGMCTTDKNFEPPPENTITPFLACGIHVDPIKSYESIKKITEIGDMILPNHDTRLLENDLY